MRNSSITIVVLTALMHFVFASCGGNRSEERLLAVIDSLTYTHPKQALLKLDSLDSCTGRTDKSWQMRCALLRVKAKFKDYQPIDSDSIIKDVALYYKGRGTRRDNMNALYLLGNYYAQRGDAPMALTSFLGAIESADTVRDARSLMLIHGMMQEMYENIFMYQEARTEAQQAVYYSEKCGDKWAKLIYLENIPWTYNMCGQQDSAEISAYRIYEEKKKLGVYDDGLVLAFAVSAQLKKENWEKAKKYLDIYERSFGNKHTNEEGACKNYYYYKAKYYIGVGKIDSACYYQKKLQQVTIDYDGEVKLYSNYLDLYYKIGNADSVYKYAKQYCSANDSTAINLNVERVVQIRGMYDYRQQQEEALRQKVEKRLAQLWGGVLVVALLLALATVCYAYKRRQKQNEEELKSKNAEYVQLMERYKELDKLYQLLDKGNAMLAKSQLQEGKSRAEKQMTEALPTRALLKRWVWSNKQVQKAHIMAKDDKCLLDADWKNLEAEMEANDSGFVGWLEEKAQILNARERRVCLLIRLGFLPSEMASLLAMTKQNVTNMRRRLLKKLFCKEGSPNDFDACICEA